MGKGPMSSKFSCEICWLKFNSTDNTPLILRNCGHSICKKCIKELLVRSKLMKPPSLNCPKCKTTTELNPNTIDHLPSFPKNYSLLLLMEPCNQSSQTCTHTNQESIFVCLDPECANKSKACFGCHKNQHFTCQSDYAIPVEKFSKIVRFEDLHLSKLNNFRNLKKQVKDMFFEVQNTVFEFIDKTYVDLSTEFPPIDNFNYDSFFMHHSNLNIVHEGEYMNCQPINYNLINQFVEQTSLILTSKLSLEIEMNLSKLLKWADYKQLNKWNPKVF